MIYNHSILGGYVCLKGSYMFHMPMLIAMLIFIKVPDDSILAEAYPTGHRLVPFWYYSTAVLHFLFSFMDFLFISSYDQLWDTGYQGISLALRYF